MPRGKSKSHSRSKKKKRGNDNGAKPTSPVRKSNNAQGPRLLAIRRRKKEERNVLRERINTTPISGIGTFNKSKLKINGKSIVKGNPTGRILTASSEKTRSVLWSDQDGRKMFINNVGPLDGGQPDSSDRLLAIVKAIEKMEGLEEEGSNDSIPSLPEQITFNLKDSEELDAKKAEEIIYRLLDKSNRLNETQLGVAEVIPSLDGKSVSFTFNRKFSMDSSDFPAQTNNVDMGPHFRKKDDTEEQFKSDVVIMDQTLFKKHEAPNTDPKQKKVLQEQQQILKRQFVAMAILGVEGGDQKKPDSFQPYHRNIPLASLMTHGGRFAFEIPGDVNLANKFQKLLLTGNENQGVNSDAATGLLLAKGTKKVRTPEKVEQSDGNAGLYDRRSTHPQKFENGKWVEGKSKLGTIHKGSMGMNIPVGGIDNTGPIGKIKDEGRFDTEEGKDSQHGHAVFLFNTDPNGGGRMMVGIESAGTGEGESNQVGSTHGIKSALGIGGGNSRSVSGQAKASKVPGLLPQKASRKEYNKFKFKLKKLSKGSLKATVTASNYSNLKTALDDLDVISNSNDPQVKTREQRIMRDLLASTTKNERLSLLLEMNTLANQLRGNVVLN